MNLQTGHWYFMARCPACGAERYLAEAPSPQSRPRESEQDDKWSFCLTAGTLCPANQERQ